MLAEHVPDAFVPLARERRAKAMRRSLAALSLSLLLVACGQTGDLYLPQKTPPPSAPPAQDQDNPKKKPQDPPPTAPEPVPQGPHS